MWYDVLNAHGLAVESASRLLAWLRRSGACACCGRADGFHDPVMPCGELVHAQMQISSLLASQITGDPREGDR